MGTGFTYTINMLAIGDSGLNRLLALLDRLDSNIDRVQADVAHLGSSMQQMAARGSSSVSNLMGNFKSLIATVGGAAVVFGSLGAAANMDSIQRTMNFAGGSAQEGAKNIAFVRDTVSTLGLPLKESLEGFKTLQGGMMGTGITANQTRDIFMSMGKGAAVMGMSADDTKGAFIALSQMASKGKVSAEELRGQLGERLPGAFNIAARSIGVTTTQLDKMLEGGKVMAADFLPKFAAEMERTFGPGVAGATNSATANFNRFHNSVLDLKVAFGEGLLPVVLQLLNGYLIPSLTWLGKHIDVIGLLVVGLGSAYAAYKLYEGALFLVSVWTKIAALDTITFTGVMGALNLTMLANPIGLLIAALAALVVGVIYAWNHFEGFRGVLFGIWEVIKPIGAAIWDFITWPFMTLGAVVKNVWGDWGGFMDWIKGIGSTLANVGKWIWEHLIDPFNIFGKVYDKIQPLLSKMGVAVSKTFDTGFQKGVADYNMPKPELAAESAANTASNQNKGQGADSIIDILSKLGLGAAPLGGSGSATGGSGAGSNGSPKATKGVEAVTSGGSKNITINLGKFMDSMVVNAANVTEGADAVADIVLRKLTQVLNSANQVQTQ